MKKKREFAEIHLVIDRVEGDKAVLVSKNDEFIIPVSALPDGHKEGDAFVLFIATDEALRKHREQRAKEFLNQILRGE